MKALAGDSPLKRSPCRGVFLHRPHCVATAIFPDISLPLSRHSTGHFSRGAAANYGRGYLNLP